MIDCFALLGEPRRPWLDAEELKRKFLTLSAGVHPDRVHSQSEVERQAAQDRYAELNSAHQRLSEPRDRLRHLLELERGAAPDNLQRIPSGLMDLFVEIGEACRQAGRLQDERVVITSPLLKVQWFERSQEHVERLRELRQGLDTRLEKLTEAVKRIDADWDAGAASGPQRTELLGRVEEAYRLLSFLGRWRKNLQDAILELSL
jgi:curved DNA-binding protein CbpA